MLGRDDLGWIYAVMLAGSVKAIKTSIPWYTVGINTI